MSGRIHRILRQSSQVATQNTAKAMAPAVTAALQNEMITRIRVDQIEALLSVGLWGRLRFLFRGWAPLPIVVAPDTSSKEA